MANIKKSKNQLRREKQKLKKQQSSADPESSTVKTSEQVTEIETIKGDLSSFDIIKENSADEPSGKLFESEIDRLLDNPEFQQFKHVFDKFRTTVTEVQEELKDKGTLLESDDEAQGEIQRDTTADVEDAEDFKSKKEEKLSRRKVKQMNKIPLAELKTMAKYPDIIQWYDADADDPLMNLALKQNKNSIPVPHHWQFKREYLVSRRGIEREQFQLPQYILDTGILSMRDTTNEDDKTLKQKSREKVQPKMNRLDLDYKKLHDAFFKFQTKPRLYGYGDLFYEGKGSGSEAYKLAKYGDPISDDLKEALGLGITFDGVYPWISKMRTHGPPPSYPWVRVLNDSLTADGSRDYKDEEETQTLFVPFGKLLSYESDHDGEEQDEEEEPQYEDDDEDEDEDEENQPVVVETSDSVDIPLENVSSATAAETPTTNDKEDEIDIPLPTFQKEDSKSVEPKALYQVLKQKLTSDREGVLNSGVTYELPASETSKRKAEDHIAKQDVKKPKNESNGKPDEDEDEDEDEEDGKFKF
ncbi:hypothetical protein WICPIJ_006181 [Wickerhamomyces pijperi]|uniref:PSP proline-rich domain-containing protein n=1 Tax=Wickerhamomyces pijperi TaxID=599730 RepID=A0A9P8Q497_WICPI|nr:hypothetical protein WICPIJ_006181 [Wickerhamomyces pijperi]